MTKTQAQGNTSPLSAYFPMIRTREEVQKLITAKQSLNSQFQQWGPEQKTEFLDFCTGMRGVKVLYDGIFKEIFNPEVSPERLESLISLILGKQVRIKAVLPNDSVRLGGESSLLYTDIIVQLDDGSLSNVEIQKIGYAFPGERAACYSADHLLRQYKRVRGEKGKTFSYRDIKSVYTIVFFDRSPREFHLLPNDYLHASRQAFQTGLKINLLQEYFFIPLDIFRRIMDNKDIENDLEAWLSFLSFDEPERIIRLFTDYPQFKPLYRDIYDLCGNIEEVVRMYSKELEELDRNTVKYMIDELQTMLDRKSDALSQKEQEVLEKEQELLEREQELLEKDRLIAKLQKQLERKFPK